jgi:DNA protecting protein DprA
MSSDTSQHPLFAEGAGHEEPRKMPTFGQSLLALYDIDGLGRKGLRALVTVFGDDLGKVWESDQKFLQRLLEDAKLPSAESISEEIVSRSIPHLAAGQHEVGRLAKDRVSIVQPSEIPKRLQEVPGPPLWLFVEGAVEALYHHPAVAVVGTRKATRVGREAAAMVSEVLAAYPITLVSGLAEGIDEEAHRASLREGVANIAFLGTGIKEVFPRHTGGLRQRIVRNGGAVVTEYLPDERYKGSYFVERNRLQAAMADVVVPVEANPRGGTAHTVRFAREFGRRIVGVRWKGTNGIVAELERDGYPIVDIFEPTGRKMLDRILRELAESENQEAFPLSLVVERLRKEAKSRDLRQADLQRLRQELEGLADEVERDGYA